MVPEVVASIVAATAAIFAVIIGPFITLRASKNQLLGPMRQAWISELRSAVAEFCARVHMGYEQVASTLAQDESVRHEAVARRTDHIESTYRLLTKIVLLINPNEAEHIELVRLARSAYSAYASGSSAGNLLTALQEHAQAVLKKEWNVVKAA